MEEAGAARVTPTREAETHRLIAGNPCLDFVNTLNGHGRVRGHEYLHDFRDLTLWSKHARLLRSHEAKLILEEAVRSPTAANGVFRRARRLRETMFRIFHAVALAKEPHVEDVQRLNNEWRRAQRHAVLRRTGRRFTRGWDDDAVLERIPRVLTGYAGTLLISSDLGRIRACDGEACDWLFIDSSRNHQRRWCSMDECGNRAKMRRRRARQRLARPGKLLPRESPRADLK